MEVAMGRLESQCTLPLCKALEAGVDNQQLRALNKAWGRTKIENNFRLFKTQK